MISLSLCNALQAAPVSLNREANSCIKGLPTHEWEQKMKKADLNYLGIRQDNVAVNPGRPILVEEAVRRGEGRLTRTGALSVLTGKYTGRSPDDRFIVEDKITADRIAWGDVNRPISRRVFERLYNKVTRHLEDRKLYVVDGWAGADPEYRIPIRIVTDATYEALFASDMFIIQKPDETPSPEFTVLAAPFYECDPEEDQIHSEAAIMLDFTKRIILIAGTRYCGEVKKSVFSVMNALLPEQGVLPMHCSANIGNDGTAAVFFGLSGTGKTTLSAAPGRRLVGDDEHGWTADGVFNFEGGCYAKCAGLKKEKEPEIWNAVRSGAVVENVVYDERENPVYDDLRYTENTRAAYPLTHIFDAELSGRGGIPSTVIFLTADAYGVLPPVARLTKEQAMYYFVSGYTSKLAGTERGITDPQAVFSTCFGEPFMPLPATVYAQMLGERIDKSGCEVFLINTGWAGGPYGKAARNDLKITRAIVDAAVSGRLTSVSYRKTPVFDLEMPESCPGVPSDCLDPREMWNNKTDYDRNAFRLAEAFRKNFEKYSDMPANIVNAGPRVTASRPQQGRKPSGMRPSVR